MKSSKRKNESYPVQTGLYKVQPRGPSHVAFYDTAILEISVGQEQHEGEKFRATAHWAGDRFDKVIVSVNDTLQRHNIMVAQNLSEEDALKKSRAYGDIWIRNNQNTLIELAQKCDCRILRWDRWLLHKNFEKRLAATHRLYESDENFREIVEEKLRKGSPEEERHSLNFLLEETAAISIRMEEIEGLHIYPGSYIRLWDAFMDNPPKEMPSLAKFHLNRIGLIRNKTHAHEEVTPFEQAAQAISA